MFQSCSSYNTENWIWNQLSVFSKHPSISRCRKPATVKGVTLKRWLQRKEGWCWREEEGGVKTANPFSWEEPLAKIIRSLFFIPHIYFCRIVCPFLHIVNSCSIALKLVVKEYLLHELFESYWAWLYYDKKKPLKNFFFVLHIKQAFVDEIIILFTVLLPTSFKKDLVKRWSCDHIPYFLNYLTIFDLNEEIKAKRDDILN